MRIREHNMQKLLAGPVRVPGFLRTGLGVALVVDERTNDAQTEGSP